VGGLQAGAAGRAAGGDLGGPLLRGGLELALALGVEAVARLRLVLREGPHLLVDGPQGLPGV